MTDPVPSNEVSGVDVQYGWLHIPDTARGTDTPAWVRLADYVRLRNGHKILLSENERLRRLLQTWEDNRALTSLPRTAPEPAAEWQPIDTAPRNGKWVLLWWPYVTDAPFVGYFHERWRMSNGDHWSTGDGPTHWMPLPAGPSQPTVAEWQPIETAPVQMEPILMTDGQWWAAGHVDHDDIRKYRIYHFAVSQEYDWTPTHWMPLPVAPSPAATECPRSPDFGEPVPVAECIDNQKCTCGAAQPPRDGQA